MNRARHNSINSIGHCALFAVNPRAILLLLFLSIFTHANGKSLPDAFVEYKDGNTIPIWNVFLRPESSTLPAPESGDYELKMLVAAESFWVRQAPYMFLVHFRDVVSFTLEPRLFSGRARGLFGNTVDCSNIRVEVKGTGTLIGIVNAVRGIATVAGFAGCSAPMDPFPGKVAGKITVAGQQQDHVAEDGNGVRFDLATGVCTVESSRTRYPMTDCHWIRTPAASVLEGAGLNGRLSLKINGRDVKVPVKDIAAIRFGFPAEIELRDGGRTTGRLDSDVTIFGTGEDGRFLHSSSLKTRSGVVGLEAYPEPEVRTIRFAAGVKPVSVIIDENAVVERGGVQIARLNVGLKNQLWLAPGAHALVFKSTSVEAPQSQVTVDPSQAQTIRVELRKGMVPPSKLYGPAPAYTNEALQARIEGEIVLRVQVDMEGNAKHVEIIQGLGYGLNESAVSAVRRWKFRPGLRNDKPFESVATIRIKFPN